MAKKTKKVEVKDPQIDDIVVEETVVETPVVKRPMVEKSKPVELKPTHPEDGWEIKDRTYYLKNNKKPLSYSIRASGIYYFDESLGYERELKHTENQKTVFSFSTYSVPFLKTI